MTTPTRAMTAQVLAYSTVAFGLVFYVVGAAIKPGYSYSANFISELNASGTPWASLLGWSGFLPLGLLFASFLVAAGQLAQIRGARLGYWLLWSQPVAFIGAAIAPCDPGCPVGGSATQVAHDILGVTTYFAGAAALILLSRSPSISYDELVKSVLFASGILFIVLFFAMLQPELAPIRGLLQRAADASLAVSIIVISRRMLRFDSLQIHT